jgi:hypothetical protein
MYDVKFCISGMGGSYFTFSSIGFGVCVYLYRGKWVCMGACGYGYGFGYKDIWVCGYVKQERKGRIGRICIGRRIAEL